MSVLMSESYPVSSLQNLRDMVNIILPKVSYSALLITYNNIISQPVPGGSPQCYGRLACQTCLFQVLKSLLML